MALQVFSEVFLKKIAKNLAPGTYVLQSSLRGKVPVGRECSCAEKLWVVAATF